MEQIFHISSRIIIVAFIFFKANAKAHSHLLEQTSNKQHLFCILNSIFLHTYPVTNCSAVRYSDLVHWNLQNWIFVRRDNSLFLHLTVLPNEIILTSCLLSHKGQERKWISFEEKKWRKTLSVVSYSLMSILGYKLTNDY